MTPTELGNVRIRYPETRDHEAYVAMEKDAEVKRYVGGPIKRTEQAILSRLRECSPCISFLAVVESLTDTYIGRCGLLEIEGSSEVELHILLAKTHRKQGIASLVVPFLVRLAAANGKTAIAYVDPHNLVSLKLMKRLGAIPDGTYTGTNYQAGHIRYVFTSQ